MTLRELKLENFRNHERLRLGCAPRGNVIVGANGARVERMSSLIGRYPLLILAPEHSGITHGPPGERRRFVDMLVCQASSGYCADLVEYRRVVKQRNQTLAGSFGVRCGDSPRP